MKAFKLLSGVFAVAGVLLAACAVLGRFIYAPSVFGGVLPPGMAASSVLVAANTLLLLAVVAHLYKKD